LSALGRSFFMSCSPTIPAIYQHADTLSAY
jgi:hypothetical protein